MGLVEYSSSSGSEPEPEPDHPAPPPAKKQRRASSAQPHHPSSTNSSRSSSSTTTTTLPPLPSSFHDLYAATVRPAAGDLPSLHQGRRRATPHVPGNWPSHVYLEWRPPPAEHTLLTSLVAALSRELSSLPSAPPTTLTSLLESDLAAPLPLHVSLSRPFVLRTHERDAFLSDLSRELAVRLPSSSAPHLSLRVDGLAWYRSPDAARSFLVLRVRSSAAGSRSKSRNPELAALVARCNAVVGARGQPLLYARARNGSECSAAAGDEQGFVDEEAFHVSVAWSFAEPTEQLRERTAAVFAREEYQLGLLGRRGDADDVVGDDEAGDGGGIRIPVDGVKVKIGNVVTHVPLEGTTGAGNKKRGLFGI